MGTAFGIESVSDDDQHLDQHPNDQTAEITHSERCSKSEKIYILEPSKDRLIERLQLQLRQKEAEGVALRQRNEDLEASKLRLITSTAMAMDDCRETVRRLSRQNLKLRLLLNLKEG